MDLSILSANLKRLRAAKQRSQTEIAEGAGLSRVGYRNIEEGVSAPRVDTLMKIAAALQVRLEELFEAPRSLDHVRFRKQKRMRSREDVLQRVSRWLLDYNDLEELLGARQVFKLADAAGLLPSKARGVERARRLAGLVREELGLDEDELIRDIAGLLEDHGVKVCDLELASPGFFGLSVGTQSGGPAVVVNVWDRISVERRIFTAAHELAHLLLHPGAYDVDQEEENEAEEREANEFASHFLMPDATFGKEWEQARGLPFLDRVLKIKAIFRVSWQSVVYRYQLSRPPAERRALWERFHRDYRARYGHALPGTEEPAGLDDEAYRGLAPAASTAAEPEQANRFGLTEDRLQRLVRDALDKEIITQSRAAEILDIKLSEMRELANSWVE